MITNIFKILFYVIILYIHLGDYFEYSAKHVPTVVLIPSSAPFTVGDVRSDDVVGT